MTVQSANQLINTVLGTQWEGEPILRVDSPPGAGKTSLVIFLLAQSFLLMKERVAAATQTNEQAFDLVRRLCVRFPSVPVVFLHRNGLRPPTFLQGFSNLTFTTKPSLLPAGSCVVVATAAKWAYCPPEIDLFDVLVIDEAFQLTDARFLPIASLARRQILVGDPGQLPPVVSVELERWSHDPSGPHIACPNALLARHPGIRRVSLRYSRRLVADTVQIVQPIFYPDLPFQSLEPAGSRGLALQAPPSPIDAPLLRAASGDSIVGVPLPARVTGEQDQELAEHISTLIERLLTLRAEINDHLGQRPLTPSDIGVVCAHVSQVTAVQERLSGNARDVLVETADRFQGLERAIMFVWHPLSGRASLTNFHLQPGRMCVMLSRHRIACFLVGRQGIRQALEDHAPSGNRLLGINEDPEHTGWLAHRDLMERLQTCGRWPTSPLHAENSDS